MACSIRDLGNGGYTFVPNNGPGWILADNGGASNGSLQLYYKWATGSESTTFTWSMSGGPLSDNQIAVMEFSGVGAHDIDWYSGYAVDNPHGTLTPTAGKECVIAYAGISKYSITPTSGETNIFGQDVLAAGYRLIHGTSGGYDTGFTGSAFGTGCAVGSSFIPAPVHTRGRFAGAIG